MSIQSFDELYLHFHSRDEEEMPYIENNSFIFNKEIKYDSDIHEIKDKNAIKSQVKEIKYDSDIYEIKDKNQNKIQDIKTKPTNYETNKKDTVDKNNNIFFKNFDDNSDNNSFFIFDSIEYEDIFKNDNNININLNEDANLKRKRGRKKNLDNGRPIHDKNDYDNMRNNLKIHFMNFLIKFFNSLLTNVFQNQEIKYFKYINSKDKKIKSSKGLNKQFNMEIFSI